MVCEAVIVATEYFTLKKRGTFVLFEKISLCVYLGLCLLAIALVLIYGEGTLSLLG